MAMQSQLQRVKSVWQLSKKAFSEYKKEIIILISFGFLGGILEGIGINAVIPLFSFLDGTYLTSDDIVTRATRFVFELLHIPFTLKFLIIFIAGLFVFKAAAVFYSKYMTEVIQSAYVRNTRIKLLQKTLLASWPYLSKQKIGYLDKVLTNDIDTAASILVWITSAVILAVNIIIYVAIAFNLAPSATLLTLGVGGLFFLFFKPIVYQIKSINTRKVELMKLGSNHIDESMIGIKTIKAMSLEEKVIEKAKIFFDEWRNISFRLSYLGNFANVLIQPVSVFVVLGLFAYSYKTTGFAFASFAVVIYSINKIFAYIQQAQIQLQNINAQYPYLRTVMEYEEEAVQNTESESSGAPFNFQKNLKFENVSFYYKNGKSMPVLENINLEIKKGETLGIIGPSGSGKTTLVDILLRLIEPQVGNLSLDGKKIEEISIKEWRGMVGYVAQENFLVNDTIKNNICFYRKDISESDMIEAAKLANIHDFIMSLPKKFETEVGERGTEISGGQKQRIALARVLARKPQILVLDEATSALDNESQALIHKSIQSLHGNVTVIIIAHRPSAVLDIDKVVVIDKGRITEEGTPSEMLADNGSYLHKIVYEY